MVLGLLLPTPSESQTIWGGIVWLVNNKLERKRRSRSYFTTDGQSVSISWCWTLGLAIRYYFLSERCCLKIAVLSLWGALSDERTDLQFAVQWVIGPSHVEPVTILYCLIWDYPNLEGQVPVCISPGTGWPSYTPGTGFPLRRLLPGVYTTRERRASLMLDEILCDIMLLYYSEKAKYVLTYLSDKLTTHNKLN
jgi:hypothetical protein